MEIILTNWLTSLFRSRKLTLWHNDIGDFRFVRRIGWVGKLPGSEIELIIGADTPYFKDESALAAIRDAAKELARLVRIGEEFLIKNASKWDASPLVFKSLQVASLQILWPNEQPNHLRIEFIPDTEDRVWYVEFDSFIPKECGFDH